jgi:hypothetical protein
MLVLALRRDTRRKQCAVECNPALGLTHCRSTHYRFEPGAQQPPAGVESASGRVASAVWAEVVAFFFVGAPPRLAPNRLIFLEKRDRRRGIWGKQKSSNVVNSLLL